MLNEELKHSMKWAAYMAVVLALVCVPFCWQCSVGVLLGVVFVSLDQYVLALQMTSLLFKTQVNYVGFAIVFFLRMALLAIPLVFAILQPTYSNVWATFIGMMLQKAFLYIQSFKSPKEGDDKNENSDSV